MASLPLPPRPGACAAERVQYGACEKPAPAPAPPPVQLTLPAPSCQAGGRGGPMFLENPDGTITEAIPFGFGRRCGPVQAKLIGAVRPSLASNGDSDDSNNVSESAAVTLAEELEFLQSRHERVLLLVLIIQLLPESLYDIVYVRDMEKSIYMFRAQHNPQLAEETTRFIFWTILCVQVIYSVVYYAIAIAALCTRRPKTYRHLANCVLIGIVGLVLLVCINEFNLVIFILRVLVYIYARFLQGLSASLVLLPPTGGSGRATLDAPQEPTSDGASEA